MNRGITLVTGGCGFLGSHVVSALKSRGDQVRVIDCQIPAQAIDDVEYVLGDITDRNQIREAMKGVNSVFHLAAKAGLWARNKRDFYRVNQEGARVVFSEAERASVNRVVHTSTESILKSYRHGKSAQITGEEVQWTLEDMCGHYCRAKFLAEQEALQAAQRGLPIVVVNPTVPIGPGDRTPTPPTRMLLGYLKGNYRAYLETQMNVVDVRDVAMGHLAAEQRGMPGQRYLLGGTNLKLSQLLKMLEKVSGRTMPTREVPYWLALGFAWMSEGWAYVSRKPPSAPLTGVRLAGSPMCFNNQKAIRELGMSFRPVEASLRDQVQWFLNEGMWG